MAQAESVLKLGKELTCPICLSLLKEAVRLPCNHCFCRACILQSIWSKASCPVCRKAAQRREVRPAADLDKVVAAYAEIERAMGVQILLSQPAKPPPQEEAQEKKKRPKTKAQKLAEEGKENQVPQARPQPKQGKPMEEAQGVSLQTEHVFKAPKKGQLGERGGGAQLTAGLVACGGSEAKGATGSTEGCVMLAGGKAKKKAATKKNGAKPAKSPVRVGAIVNQIPASPPLPALAECAPSPNQRAKEGSPGGRGFQPFFWMGGQGEEHDLEGGTQLGPTQGSPPVTFSDLVSSRGKDGVASPEGEVSRGVLEGEKGADLKKKGRKKAAAVQGGGGLEHAEKAEKAGSVREEFYSCEDDAVLDASLQDDPLGDQGPALPQEPVLDDRQKGKQRKRTKENSKKNGAQKSGVLASKATAAVSKEATARNKKEKLKAEIRESVAAAVGETGKAADSSSREAKLTSASGEERKQRAGKRKRGAADVSEDATEAPGVSAGVSHTPHASKKPSGEDSKTPSMPASKTPIPQLGDTGLCPSTSRPANPQQPPTAFCGEPVCGFCGQNGDSKVAGKLVRNRAAPIGLLAAEGFEGMGAESESGGKRKRVQLSSVVVHELCAQWAPNVFFEGEEMANLDSELARSRQLKCSVCSGRGAALGCFLPRCRHTYHYACSRQLEGCRFDEESYVMLCPDHALEKLPCEMETDESDSRDAVPDESKKGGPRKRTAPQEDPRSGPKRPKTAPSVQAAPAITKWAGAPGAKWVLTGSGLSPQQKDDLALLAHSSGATLVKDWSPHVTHVVAGVDGSRRSKRTLKFLTAVLTGQWLVTPEWVTASLEQGQPAKEAAFEVVGDAQNETGGPKKGRMAARKGAPPLFDGIDFFLSGDWPGTPSKADMAAVIAAGGGTVLARRPLPNEEAAPKPSPKPSKSDRLKTVILYFGGQSVGGNAPPAASSDSVDGRRSEALGLSASAGKASVVVHHRWLLDSASAFQLQDALKY